jgi:hypothetical protein
MPQNHIFSLNEWCFGLAAEGKGIPNLFWAKCLFGGLGYQGQQITHFQEEHCFLSLPPSAASPNNHSLLENVWFFGLGTPGLKKTTWPKIHFGIPLSVGRLPQAARKKR